MLKKKLKEVRIKIAQKIKVERSKNFENLFSLILANYKLHI
jgi:hypothetical protein